MNGDPGDEERKETYHPCVKSRKLELHSLKEESDMEGKGSSIAWTFSNSTSDRSFISWLYRERACARCGGCGSRLRSPSACVRIAPSASCSPPSESVPTFNQRIQNQQTFSLLTNQRCVVLMQITLEAHAHLQDVVSVENTPSIATVPVLSDRTLQL